MPRNVVVQDVSMHGVSLFCEVSDKLNPRPLIPKPMRNTVINLMHHMDHPGRKETIKRISRDYYWPGLRKDITIFVRSCHPCQLAKQSQTVNPGIGEFPVPDRRFSHLHVDIVGPLPESEGCKYLLTVLDRCSRWLEAFPLPQDSSMEVCKAFMQWVSRFGLPDRVVSDNGNAFIANLFQDVMKTFNIPVSFTPVYHAQTNGAIERSHQTLKNSLKASLVDMGDTHRENWQRALPWVLLGKRVQYQPHLDASSAQLVLATTPRIPGQLLGEAGPPLNTAQTRALLEQLYKLSDRPGVPMSGKRESANIQHTESATHVYVKIDNPKNLGSKFEGPYEILERPSRSTVKIKVGTYHNNEPRTLVFHWSACKVANMRENAIAAERPKLGRPKKSPVERHLAAEDRDSTERHLAAKDSDNISTTSQLDASNDTDRSLDSNVDNPVSEGKNLELAVPKVIQMESDKKPVRSTRNRNPRYN